MRRINSVFCFQVRSAATVTFSKVTVASSYTITSMDYSPIAHPTVTGTTRAWTWKYLPKQKTPVDCRCRSIGIIVEKYWVNMMQKILYVRKILKYAYFS